MGALELPKSFEGPWWHYFWSTGDVIVFHVDLRCPGEHEEKALGWLDEKELSRYRRFQFPGPARRFALCRSALRAILCRYLDAENSELFFDISSFEKPFALARGKAVALDFSVSHSLNHGLIALAPMGRVGVDVEERQPRRHLDGLIEMVMSQDERAMFRGLEEGERQRLFFRIWTMKEALLKGLGTGLRTDMSSVEIPVSLRQGGTVAEFRFADLQNVAWTLADFGTEYFAAALAYERTG